MDNWFKRTSAAAFNFSSKDEQLAAGDYSHNNATCNHRPDTAATTAHSSPASTASTSLTSSTSSTFSTSSTSSQPITPPHWFSDSAMPSTSPIDIATPTRNASSSPSSQGTKRGDYLGVEDSRTSAIMSGGGPDPVTGRNRRDSFAGAKPISMNNPNRNGDARPRRESLAGSLVGGMSWGGVSVGSWIRDDIMMTGTSPFPYQSPSFQSSSYLPKLEANFMRDFTCCGETLPTLHDLLQHYEECHAQQTPQSLRTASAAQQVRDHPQPNSKAAIAAQAATSVQQQTQQQQARQHQTQQQQQGGRPQTNGLNMAPNGQGISSLTGGIQQMRQQQQQQQSQPTTPTQQNAQPMDDMDGVEDMEIDDPVGPMDPVDTAQNPNNQRGGQQQQMFGQRPTLNLNNNTGMLHQGLRTSQPTTPSTTSFGFQNNPTVSSVNTPTLSTQPLQGQSAFSPETSIPNTPAEMEEEVHRFTNMNMANTGNVAFPFNGNNDLGLDLCIDEPAKRLYSPNGGFANNSKALQQQFAAFGLGNGNSGLNGNEELMRRFRQQQMMQMQGMSNVGNPAVAMMMAGEEHKPFRCPVIGCEKAYKNQNGLKYHKSHGHQTQQLHENGDGTFSIVNPETSAPYPGTLGMEKEKPYKCEICGKRYKNLNGLKYHKQHSPPCNPEMKLNGHLHAVGLPGLGVNVAGLPGIGEEGIM
ncbi:MAG: Transcriptional regulator of ribosomal biogenesis proteins [Claussenomyces sp. TS43310]|nr:MAG: Transcriptional regulator of ribosomal biogenesis proteins [Claussenomyces sp. TS43310]